MFVGNERKITVKSAELLSKLREGLEKHEAEYAKASSGYKEAAVDFLEQALERAKTGDLSDIHFRLSAPSNNAKDFERAIAMIQMSVALEIEIDEQTFKRWVLGEWDWAGNFEASAMAIGGYLTKSLAGRGK